MGHYGSLHDREQAQPVIVRVDPPEAVLASMVQVLEDYYQPEEGKLFLAPFIGKGGLKKR